MIRGKDTNTVSMKNNGNIPPKNDPWAEIFKGLDMFTDDFMEDGCGRFEQEFERVPGLNIEDWTV